MKIEGALLRFVPRTEPAARLFCLSCAGSSATAYRPCAAALPDGIEVIGVELGGRGTRWSDPLGDDLREVASSLALEVAGRADRPFALFGHSMGALLA